MPGRRGRAFRREGRSRRACRARLPPYAVLVESRRSVRRRRKRGARPARPPVSSGAGYPFAMTRRAVTLFSGVLLLVALVLLSGRARLDNTYVELVPGPTFDTLGSSDGKQLI